MIYKKTFIYKPEEYEAEKASNSYLMSLVVFIVGLPLPFVNLLSSYFFYIGNRKGTYFVRWHCIHALLAQLFLFLINTLCFLWAIAIIVDLTTINNLFITYTITILIFNLAGFIASVYSAVQIRKRIHVEWWFFGSLTNLICKV